MIQSAATTSTHAASSVPPEPAAVPRKLLRQSLYRWPLLVLVLSLTITGIRWQNARREAERQNEVDFERTTSGITVRIQNELLRHESLLRGVKGLFSASDEVTRDDFRRYFAALKIDTKQSGFSAMAYHQLVPARDLEAHEASVRREGFADYRVFPEGNRDVYAPMFYIEPFEGANRKVIGFDPLTVETERVAVEHARDSGETSISGKLVLAQDGEKGAPGFVMYVPIYRNGTPVDTVAQRRESFIGWVDAPYRMSNLVAGTLPSRGLEHIDLAIYDGVGLAADKRMYPPEVDASPISLPGLHIEQTISFGGHNWTLAFRARPDYGAAEAVHKAGVVALSGVLLSILFSLLVALLAQWQHRRLVVELKRIERAKNKARDDERERAEEALRESERRFRQLMENIPNVAVQGYKADGTILFWNKASERLYGYRADEALGANLIDLVVPDDLRATIEDAMREMVSTGNPAPSGELLLKTKDGGQVPVFSSTALVYPLGGPPEFFCLDIDLSDRKRAEEQLQKLSLAVEQSPSSIVITNVDAEIEYANEAFVTNSGYSREEAYGKNPRILQSGETDADVFADMWTTLTQGRVWKGELHNRRKDGVGYTEFVSIAPLRQPDGRVTHYVAVKDDITEMKAAEKEINSLAFYDPLTHLPNRRLLVSRLQESLASLSRSHREGAVMLIDLDNFKTLNDTYGHDVGDLLLQHVAQRISACVREDDTVARLGGDEFVVVLETLSGTPQEAVAQARVIGEAILANLTQPYQLGSYCHVSTASIGVTLFADLQKTEDLLKQADLAMYQAKSAGRNAMRFFDPEMQKTATERAELEADLRTAVASGQFLLHYQPQVVGDHRVTGAEVLVRWQHPERGLVAPGDFIPLAEDTKLILPIGRWVLETACAQLARWASQPALAHLTLAVNVSAMQFRQPDFVEQVISILDAHGANARRLKLELTENLLVEDVEDVILKMTALRIKGVCFSLDDFGTGYSSLSYLKRMPLDQLKIDRGFVRDILTDPNDAAIAKVIIALAESMGLSVIAEGVELEAQRQFLAHHGCHAYQGYLFSRPTPLDEFEQRIKEK